MLTGEQGGFQAEKGVRRSFCRQVVYLHPVKHEQHLLSFSWEVRDVLQPLETVHKPGFFFSLSLYLLLLQLHLCIFPCTALKDQVVRISQRCLASLRVT